MATTSAPSSAGLPPTSGGTTVVPCLLVDDMPSALAFYADALHLRLLWASGATSTSVPVDDVARRGEVEFGILRGAGGAEVMLQLRTPLATSGYLPEGTVATTPPQGTPLTLYIRGVDVDAAVAGLPPSVEVLVPPRNMPYGSRELTLRDPAGHVVILCCPTGDK
ncbi:hypothetical protein MMPV_007651 [Pyropia vietnamensis]